LRCKAAWRKRLGNQMITHPDHTTQLLNISFIHLKAQLKNTKKKKEEEKDLISKTRRRRRPQHKVKEHRLN